MNFVPSFTMFLVIAQDKIQRKPFKTGIFQKFEFIY